MANLQEIAARRYVPQGSTPIRFDDLPGAVAYVNGTCALAYAQRAHNPTWNYRFRTPERRDAAIAQWFADLRERRGYMAKRAEQRKALVLTLKPGDILHYSWGYDQTQCEFYQVLSVTKKTATIRRIESRHAGSGDRGTMSEELVACPGRFLDHNPVRKTAIDGTTLRMPNGCAYLWDGSPKYHSWYG